MLGLNNNSNHSGNRIKLVDGAFRMPSSQGTLGAELRKAMNPQTKETVELWEIPYKNMSAYIKDIVKEEGKYGSKVNIVLEADKDYTLTFNPDNNFLLGIFKRLPNVNPALPIDFSATLSPDDEGKMQTSLFMAQNGNNIAWKHTNKEPNGMPLAKKVMFNGKEVTDKTEQITFLWDKVVTPFLAELKTTTRKRTDEVSLPTMDIDLPTETGIDYGEVIDPSDIPF